jgi:hypothetical protein
MSNDFIEIKATNMIVGEVYQDTRGKWVKPCRFRFVGVQEDSAVFKQITKGVKTYLKSPDGFGRFVKDTTMFKKVK